ncbi:hypothetical protein D3C84_1228790 [compost metagenome]
MLEACLHQLARFDIVAGTTDRHIGQRAHKRNILQPVMRWALAAISKARAYPD